MTRTVVRRLILAPLTLWVISGVSFLLLHFAPGGLESSLLHGLGLQPTPETIASLRAQLGLDRPLLVRYGEWLTGALRLEFGRSYITGQPIGADFAQFMPATIELAAAALAIALAVSIPAGIFSAVRAGGRLDLASRLAAIGATALPAFWLGYLAMYTFSVWLDLLPLSGRGTWGHLVLPAITLAAGQTALFARLLRNSMVEELRRPYARFGRARGLRERHLIGRHVLRNAGLPLWSALGVAVGSLLSGAVVVETVFAWPGMGRYFLAAILARDLPVVQAYICCVAAIVIAVNLVADLVHAVLDPRVAVEGSGHA